MLFPLSKVIIRRTSLAGVLLLLAASGISQGAAQHVNDNLLQKSAGNFGDVFDSENTLARSWRDAMYKRYGLELNADPGGVELVPGQPNKFLLHEMSTVQSTFGGPGWAASRIAAYERAELQAKAHYLSYLGNNISNTRGLKLLESVQFSEQDQTEIQRLGRLSLALGQQGAVSDAVVAEALQYYASGQVPNGLLSVDRLVLARESLAKNIKSRASRYVSGATTIYSAEGFIDGTGGEYAVVVTMIVTPNLYQLAKMVGENNYSFNPQKKGRPIRDWIPSDTSTLISQIGTRVVVDENGQYSVLSFGQAQAQIVNANRSRSAIEKAKRRARLYAEGYLRNFLGESIATANSVQNSETSMDFSDGSSSVAQMEKFQNKIDSIGKEIRLKGVSQLGTWSKKHPALDQTLAGAVVLWSPSRTETGHKSNSASTTLDNVEVVTERVITNIPSERFSGESMEVDVSEY